MKDTEKLKDYRLKYKRHYGIEFGREYAVHHMDFDRSNNAIDNLLLLPRELHAKYHMLINDLGGIDKCGNITFNALINLCGNRYTAPIIEQLGAVIQEINKWTAYKQQLELQKEIGKTRF